MGEYADMILEGHACATCGEIFHDDDADGIPRYCSVACEPDGLRTFPVRKRYSDRKTKQRHMTPQMQRESFLSKKHNCHCCKKRFRLPESLAQHMRDAHPDRAAPPAAQVRG